MPDKLDELLGTGQLDDNGICMPTSSTAMASAYREEFLDDAVGTIRTGPDVARVLKEAYSAGYADSAVVVKRELEEITRKYGKDFAREWRKWKLDALSQEDKKITKERGDIKRKLRVAEAQLAHAEAISDAIAAGEFIFKPRAFMAGNPRLRAHEILEQINTDHRRLLVGPLEDGHLENDWFSHLSELLLRCEKFDIRSIENNDLEFNAGFSHVLEADGLLQAPYPDCWFEWDVEPGHTVAGIVSEREDGGYSFSSFVRVKGAGWCNWDNVPKDTEGRYDYLTDHVELVCRAALVLLNSRSTTKTEIAPPIGVNRKRERRGEPPLFSHTVIEIHGVVLDRRGSPTGRTHRSPRMHWRRGHLRRFKDSGGSIYRITPIAPMLVGRADLGRVDHDYIVSPTRHKTAA